MTYDGKYDFWQYSSKGAVEGIKGNVDLDHQYVMKPGKIIDFYVQSNTLAAISEYTDETAEQGIEYDYKVRAFYKFQKGNRGGTYSDLVTAATIILLDPIRNLCETDCTDEGLEAGEKYDYQIHPFAQTKGGNFILFQQEDSDF